MVKNNDTWISNVRKKLYTFGLAYLYHSTMKESAILDTVYDRMCDVYKQTVVNDISNSSKCILYKHSVDYFCLQV